MRKLLRTVALVLALALAVAAGACGQGKLSISMENLELVLGESFTLTAEGNNVQWESKNPSVAEVKNGIVTAKGLGNTEIVAVAGGSSAVCSVIVVEDKITLSKDSVVLGVGGTILLTADVRSGKTVTWSSNLSKVATVDENGLVTAHSVGEAKIRADITGYRASCTVTVSNTEPVFEIAAEKDLLEVGQTSQIRASLTVYNAETGFVTIEDGFNFRSLKPAVGSVNDAGLVTAVGAGGTEIVVEHPDYEVSESVLVDVVAPISDFSLTERRGINVFGRVDTKAVSGKTGLAFVNSASGFEIVFSGTELKAKFSATCDLTPYNSYLRVFADGEQKVVALAGGTKDYTLLSGLSEGLHRVRVFKMTEEDYSTVCLLELFGENLNFYTSPQKPKLKIEFYGDSITAGYGSLGSSGDTHSADKEDGTSTYAFFAAEALRAQAEILCMQGNSLAVRGWRDSLYLKDVWKFYSVESTKVWDFSAEPSDYIVINLGENDAYGIAQGYGTEDDFIDGYLEMIAGLRRVNPNAKIICCYGMMSRSVTLGSAIENMVENLNREGDSEVFALKMILCSGYRIGAAGHPGKAGHEENGALLAAFIREIENGRRDL